MCSAAPWPQGDAASEVPFAPKREEGEAWADS